MKLILTAGVLCAALLLAVVSTVHAQSKVEPPDDSVTPITLVGE